MFSNLPPFVKSFITDFIETGIAAVFAVTFVVPSSVDDVKKIAIAFGAALLGAFVSAARRAAPGFVTWLKSKFA